MIVMYKGHPYYLVDIQEKYNTAFIQDLDNEEMEPRMVNLSEIDYSDASLSEDYIYLLDDKRYQDPLNIESLKYVEKILNCPDCLIALQSGGLYTMSVESKEGAVLRFSISIDGHEDGNVDV